MRMRVHHRVMVVHLGLTLGFFPSMLLNVLSLLRLFLHSSLMLLFLATTLLAASALLFFQPLSFKHGTFHAFVLSLNLRFKLELMATAIFFLHSFPLPDYALHGELVLDLQLVSPFLQLVNLLKRVANRGKLAVVNDGAATNERCKLVLIDVMDLRGELAQLAKQGRVFRLILQVLATADGSGTGTGLSQLSFESIDGAQGRLHDFS